MTRLLIGLCLSLFLTLPALAAPGDPRFLQGTVEWPAALTGEPVIIVRGDDGRVYSADVGGARRQGADLVKVGGRVALLILEGSRPHDVTAIVIGAGDAVSLARALSGSPAQAAAVTPAAAPAPPAPGPAATTPPAPTTPPQPAAPITAVTIAPAPAPAVAATPAPVPAAPAAVAPTPPAAAPPPPPAPPTPAVAATAPTPPAAAPRPAAGTVTAPPPPTGPIPAAAPPAAPSVAAPPAPAAAPTVVVSPPPPAVPSPPVPAVAPPPVAPSAPPKATGPSGDRKQWARVDGKVQSVEGALLVLKADNGSIVMVDISQLNPNISQALRRGRVVSVYGYPLEQKFEAAGYIELDPSHPEPPRLRSR